jgi:hypothetical protein
MDTRLHRVRSSGGKVSFNMEGVSGVDEILKTADWVGATPAWQR